MLQSQELIVDKIARFQTSYPVDVNGLATALGIRIVAEDLPENVSGKIELDWLDDPVITVNSRHPLTRRRFTIAHEIAHFVLHRNLIRDGIVDNALYRDDRIGEPLERQANRYAASLLMPLHLVRVAWARGVRSVPGLAASFQVSPAVAEIRWRELGCVLWPDAEEELPF